MYPPEPRLGPTVLASCVAAVCFAFAYKVKDLPDFFRFLLILFGAIALIMALFTAADWLVWRFNLRLKELREAWYRPQIWLVEWAGLLNDKQIDLINKIGPLNVTGKFTSLGVKWYIHADRFDLPLEWVGEYLEQCQATYPNLVPQHGMTDSMERDFVQAFTGLMVRQGYAEPAVGNQSAKWTVPLSTLYDQLFAGDNG